MPIDICLPYELNDNGLELRYALRGVEKYLSNVGDVYLVGDKPDWYTGKHIPFNQTRGNILWKQKNIFDKVIAALPYLTDDFLFMNDDHFLLTHYDARFFPYYYDELLDWQLERSWGYYKSTVQNTIDLVGGWNKFADCHCPVIYKKTEMEFMRGYKWNTPNGYCIKSLYCYLNSSYDEPYPDLKIKSEMELSDLLKLTDGRKWFSTGDKAMGREMRQLLKYFYPKPSKYEQ